jgi:TPR repeat protein
MIHRQRPSTAPPRRRTIIGRKKRKKKKKTKRSKHNRQTRPSTAPPQKTCTPKTIDVTNPHTSYCIGLHHQKRQQDTEKALQYYALAATQKHPRSQYNLAMLLKQSNPTHCMALLNQIIQIPSSIRAKAYVALGDMTNDPTHSTKLYQASAKLKYAVGQFKFGQRLFNGVGTVPNRSRGIKLMLLASNQELADAQSHVATIHSHGLVEGTNLSIKQCEYTAIYWWTKAANHGKKEAQYFLGKAILSRFGGVKRNETKATDLFLKAAKQDFMPAQVAMGTACFHGIGTATNYQEAAHWYHQAAQQGSTKARKCLKVMHGLGLDMPLHFPPSLRKYVLGEFKLKVNTTITYRLPDTVAGATGIGRVRSTKR